MPAIAIRGYLSDITKPKLEAKGRHPAFNIEVVKALLRGFDDWISTINKVLI